MTRRTVTTRRSHLRKQAGEHVNPEYTAVGPPIAEFEKPRPCPMIAHLRAIGAPLFEDVPLRPRRARHAATIALHRRTA